MRSRQTAVALAAVVALLAVAVWLVAPLLSVDAADAEVRLEWLRGALAGFGPLAPLAYIGLVTVEVVVAPLPGLVLYAPGGIIFGGFWGGLYSWIGNVLGAALAFALARALGRTAVSRWLARHELDDYESRLARNGVWVVFLLRLNPLTSSDIVSYAAGLGSMPWWRLVAGTALGMAPLCWAQAYAAAGVLERYPWLLGPLVVLALVYVAGFVGAAILLRRRAASRRVARLTDESSSTVG